MLSVCSVILYLADISFHLIFSPVQVHTLFQMKFLQWFCSRGIRPGCQLPPFQKTFFLFTEGFPVTMDLLSNYLGTQWGYLVSSSLYKYILNQQSLTDGREFHISAEMHAAVQCSSILPPIFPVFRCSAVPSLCWITAAPGSFHTQPWSSSSGSPSICCLCSVPLMPGSYEDFNNAKRLF